MVRIGIIGARGFAGGELLRLGLNHPHFQITYVTSESQAGQDVEAGFPGLRNLGGLQYQAYDPDAAMAAADAFFFALPDGEAMAKAEPLLAAGKKVVDLSGDFRIRRQPFYEHWYKRTHVSPHLLSLAAYGMPELRPEVREASLIGNPGCYPTATLLAVAPLFARGLAVPDSLVVSAASGVSGAGGRSALDPSFSFAAIHDNFRPYSVVGHRHTAEMEQELEELCGAPVALQFTPHLLPLMRGILATCYVTLKQGVGAEDLTALYQEFYARAPFVQVLAEGLPELRWVTGTNTCQLAVKVDPRTRRALCFSAIDNLVKGAAGSAIQNMNLICGLEETAGLPQSAFGP